MLEVWSNKKAIAVYWGFAEDKIVFSYDFAA